MTDASAGSDLTVLERAVLNLIQTQFPVCSRPYAVIGTQLGVTEAEAHAAVQELARKGIIRRVGAVFDTRKLGFASTLVAMQVPPERIEEVAAAVSRHPGVSHNYERSDAWNLWFTLQAANEAELAREVDGLKLDTGITALMALPAIQTYKIGVNFDFDKGSA